MLLSIFMPVKSSGFLWDLNNFLVEVLEKSVGRGRHSVFILLLAHVKLSLLRVTISNDLTCVVHIYPPYGSLFAKLQAPCFYLISG